MTLRKKSLTLICLAVAALILALYATSRVILLSSFAELEEQTTQQNVERALTALSEELSALDTTASDWASWDDTYEFMGDKNSEYVESNLVDDTFVALDLDLLLLVDSSGDTTFARAFDVEDEREVPFPESLLEHLTPAGLLSARPGNEDGASGIILLDEGPILIASRPVLTSEDEGPMRGWLLMGRYFDTSEVERLAETTLLSLSVHDYGDPQIPTHLLAVQSLSSAQERIVARPTSAESISGYALLRDIYGDPALVLRADMPRGIYQQGQSSIRYFMASLLIAGLVFAGVTLLGLEQQVLHPVRRLSEVFSRVRRMGDLSARVPVTGRDELSTLGREINSALQALEHAQAKLRHSQLRYRAIVEDQTELICRFRPDGTLTFANTAFYRYFGREPGESIGQPFVPPFLDADREKVQKEIDSPDPDKLVSTVEQRVVLPSGEIRWQQWTNRAIFDDAGHVVEFQSVGRDITDQKTAEKALRKYSERLEEMVAERTKQLQDAQEELVRKEKLASLGQLAGAVNHELRNPLAVISNAVYYLRMTLPDLDETASEYLEMISSEVRKSEKIVSDLLDFSRARSPDREHVTVSSLINSALERVPPQKGVKVSTDVPADLPPVFVDSQQIEQVLYNLVTNAYQAMPEGGLLTVGARREASGVHLSVTDTGCGIPEDTIGRLFEPLFTTKPRGIGLGLAVSKTFAEANGGRIEVESTQGRGSTFTVVLPTE